MKKIFRSAFSPLLILFESGIEEYVYKESHRKVLITIGVLFGFLGSVVFWLAQGHDIGYLTPVIVFGGIGLVSLVVGLLGNDRAVAKIWDSQ